MSADQLCSAAWSGGSGEEVRVGPSAVGDQRHLPFGCDMYFWLLLLVCGYMCYVVV